MKLSSLLRNRNSRAARSSKGRGRRRSPWPRLLLERLEDRIAPANVFWNVDANGFWDVAPNWRDESGVNRLPTGADTVFLDRPAGSFTVTHRLGDDQVNVLNASRSNLVMSGGVLVLSNQASVDELSLLAGGFTLSGGELRGDFRIAGNMTWSGGDMHLATVYNSGTMTLTGAGGAGRLSIFNSGTINDNTGIGLGYSLTGSAYVVNRPTGVYNLLADVIPASAFENEGTLRKSGGTGTVSYPRFYSFGGTVDVRSGSLVLDGRTPGVEFPGQTTWTGGTFEVAAGSFLDVVGIARNTTEGFKLQGTYAGSGAGTVRILSQSLVLDSAGATFGFSGGPLEFQGTEIITGAAGLNNTGGMKLVANSTVSLSGVLNNSGSIAHAGPGDLQLAFGGVDATLNNLTGGLYDVQGDADFTLGTFNNAGTLRKSAGAGTTIVEPRNFSNQGGTIDVRSGTMQISGPLNSMAIGALSTGGLFTVAAGAVLDLTSTEHVVSYSGTYTGSGAGAVRLRTGVLQVGPAGATFNFPPGLFQWTGGVLNAGTAGLANVGEITLAGSDDKVGAGVFNNAGTVTDRGTRGLVLAGFNVPGGTFNNLAGGLYDLHSDFTFLGGVFNNAGTLRKSAGTGFDARTLNNLFNNQGGTIDIRTGGFLLQGASGAPFPTHTGGNFLVAAGAFLDLINDRGTQVLTGNFTGSGEGVVRITGVVNTGFAVTVGTGGATFDFPPGLLNWVEGVIDAREAPLTNRGSMTVDVNTSVGLNPFVRLKGTLQNAGTILHVDDGILSIDGENGLGNVTNLAGGLYEFRGAGTIQRGVSAGPGAAVHNFGTWRKTGTGTATIDTDLPFDNVGTVEVNAGRLFVKSPVAQVTGTTLTGGTWQVHADGLLELEDHPRLTVN
jgi:hypothetical protein